MSIHASPTTISRCIKASPHAVCGQARRETLGESSRGMSGFSRKNTNPASWLVPHLDTLLRPTVAGSTRRRLHEQRTIGCMKRRVESASCAGHRLHELHISSMMSHIIRGATPSPLHTPSLQKSGTRTDERNRRNGRKGHAQRNWNRMKREGHPCRPTGKETQGRGYKEEGANWGEETRNARIRRPRRRRKIVATFLLKCVRRIEICPTFASEKNHT